MYTKKFTPTNINGANIINMIIKRNILSKRGGKTIQMSFFQSL
ncbi:WSSV171 [White spot syndrome virus]|nr:WSSV171 [White spot syndrome virus]AYV99434.1 WSSV125 [White spot syndrome virus]